MPMTVTPSFAAEPSKVNPSSVTLTCFPLRPLIDAIAALDALTTGPLIPIAVAM